MVFDLAWSGSSFGNGATATGRITIEDSLLANPGDNSNSTPGLVTAFTITVSGGSTGDGTFTLGDFNNIVLNTGWLALDFSTGLFGQPTAQDPWGTSQPGNTGGDFNVFAASPAPNGTSYFELTTNGGTGDKMLLTTFRPARPGTTIDATDRFAWGQNIGWTDWRHDTGEPGKGATIGQYFCSGLIWGENVGWIDLGSNGTLFVKTNTIDVGPDTDLDMIADAWELEQSEAAGLGPGLTHLDKATDTDGDGKTDLAEYFADTDPFDFADYAQIVAIGRDEMTAEIFIEWTSSPRRLYEFGSPPPLRSFQRRPQAPHHHPKSKFQPLTFYA